jgi:hypothetical protein
VAVTFSAGGDLSVPTANSVYHKGLMPDYMMVLTSSYAFVRVSDGTQGDRLNVTWSLQLEDQGTVYGSGDYGTHELITMGPGGYWQRYAGGAGTITGACYHGIGSYIAPLFCDIFRNDGSGSATHTHNHAYTVVQ